MYMKGNLFFVYEGLNIPGERTTQLDKSYIYSDGKGAMGRVVQKIHEIMDSNLNIAHWNIISYQGALEARIRSSKVSQYYVDSYRNWIEYEFPDADCYFLSISTMTGWYDKVKDADAINNALKAAFRSSIWIIRIFSVHDFRRECTIRHRRQMIFTGVTTRILP